MHGPVPGLFEQPTVSAELWKFLREHHNMVETSGGTASFHMLAAGRVDYIYTNLSTGIRNVAAMGLSGQVEPLLSGSVIEEKDIMSVLARRAFRPLWWTRSRAR